MITMSFYLFILLIKNVQNTCIRVQGVITVHAKWTWYLTNSIEAMPII